MKNEKKVMDGGKKKHLQKGQEHMERECRNAHAMPYRQRVNQSYWVRSIIS